MENQADAIIRRQIALLRVDAGIRKEVLPVLEAMQKDLLARIAEDNFARATNLNQVRVRKLLKDVAAITNDGYEQAAQAYDDSMAKLYGHETDFMIKLADGLGVTLAGLPPVNVVNAASEALIVGAPAETWWSRQAASSVFQFQNRIRAGVLEGRTTGQIVDQVREDMALAKRNAEALVRTGVQAVASKASQDLFYANRDIILAVQFVATLDSRTTETCIARSGLRWANTAAHKPIGHSVPYAVPPLHYNCRSRLIPLMSKKEKLDGTQSAVGGPVPASWDFGDWLKSQPEHVADDVLGKGKAKLWRDGKITLTDLLDQTGRPLTLTELAAL